MATKNISITEEAYKRLANHRKKNESFSEIIIEITRKVNLDKFFGVLSKETAEGIEENIKKAREEHRKRRGKRLEKITKEFV